MMSLQDSYFRLNEAKALKIIKEVKSAVNNWKKIATKYGISKAEQALKSKAFQHAI